MNSYELSRTWFDYSFSNPDKIKPNHTAVYFFAIEHCNRLGWKEKFGFPTTMAMEALGIKSYNTYINTLTDLVELGFIKMIQKSKNQYSANIIALSNFNKAPDKALDKALIKHGTKQSESTVQSIDSIIKQVSNKQYNKEQLLPLKNILDKLFLEEEKKEENKETVFSFKDFWSLYPNKTGKAESEKKYNKLSEEDRLIIKETIKSFIDNKPFKDYNHPNPLTYINQKRWLDNVDETKKDIPEFVFNFKEHGGDMNLFNKLKLEHERKHS